MPSPAPTVTPTATPTPTPTPTPLPRPVYLPLLLREPACQPTLRYTDVVLVIDASLSMLEPAAGGRTKLDLAIAAVRDFVGGLALSGGPGTGPGDPAAGDRAAIVAFNSGATRLAGLTANRVALERALAQVAAAPQTCIVCGLEAAAAILANARQGGVTPVIVLLTDGRSNPRPVADAEAVAAAAKAAGVVLFTIGLGADVEADALRRMASRPEFAYRAPSAEDLAAIYRAVAGAIPCDARQWWGGR
jgi:Mg-chelatase subunit ChlD